MSDGRGTVDNSNVHDRRVVKLEEVLKKDFIPFKGGRPARNTVIGKEDVLNLSIALNTAKSLDEFLAQV